MKLKEELVGLVPLGHENKSFSKTTNWTIIGTLIKENQRKYTSGQTKGKPLKCISQSTHTTTNH